MTDGRTYLPHVSSAAEARTLRLVMDRGGLELVDGRASESTVGNILSGNVGYL